MTLTKGKLTLTREQRNQLFAGHCPRIAGEGRCPVQKGYVYRLSSRLEFEVEQVWRTRKGGWSLAYIVRDRRDDPRFLRRTPTIPQGEFRDVSRRTREIKPPTPGSIRAAADESAYSTRPAAPVLGKAHDEQPWMVTEQEGVDAIALERFGTESHHDQIARRLRAAEREQERPLHEQLEDILAEARAANVDITRQEAMIRRRIDGLRRYVERSTPQRRVA